MGIVELLLIAVGLSMDAFAVSICKGLGMRRVNLRVAFVLALFFGGFQGLMPVIGWALGSQFMQAIATSIDALAVGISFAALSVDIAFSAALIGITTFVLSVAGVFVGNYFGSRYERPAGIVGGIVLILIGLKVLLEHLGILAL